MTEEKRYEIDGQTFVQRPLVLGQWRQLSAALSGVAVSPDMTPAELILALGPRLFEALAVILTPISCSSPRDKDLTSLADTIEWGIAPETAVEAITHFFELNPISSVLSGLTALAAQLKARMIDGIGSTNSASSSQMETSPVHTGSSGASA
jgi:hypothetical protein